MGPGPGPTVFGENLQDRLFLELIVFEVKEDYQLLDHCRMRVHMVSAKVIGVASGAWDEEDALDHFKIF